MPMLTTVPKSAAAMVLLDLNWSDDPEVLFAGVWRVVDGAAAPARSSMPALHPTGRYSQLSAGRAVFYDTEAPLDTPVRYEARAPFLPYTVGNDTVSIVDSFARTVAAGWGVTPGGAVWASSGGDSADYTVDSGRGLMALTSTNSRNMTISATVDVLVAATVVAPTLAVGGPLFAALAARRTPTGQYHLEVELTVSGTVNVKLVRVVGGSFSSLTSSAPTGHVYGAGTALRMKLRVTGQPGVGTGVFLAGKVWPHTAPEPTAWQVTALDHSHAGPGAVACRAQASTAFSGGFPQTFAWDDVTVTPLSTPGSPVVVASGGSGWLKDPLRPGNTIRLDLCATPAPSCFTDGAVHYVGLGEETFDDDATILGVAGRPRPAVTHGPRKDVASALTVLSRTLADRNRVQALLAAGGPLLLQLPAVYGWADGYLQVGPVRQVRIARDQRRPWRRHTLPFVVADPPAGPAEGVPGVRWIDQCAAYPTWDALDAANVTGLDLLHRSTPLAGEAA